jgi:hypothetical protein
VYGLPRAAAATVPRPSPSGGFRCQVSPAEEAEEAGAGGGGLDGDVDLAGVHGEIAGRDGKEFPSLKAGRFLDAEFEDEGAVGLDLLTWCALW